MPMDDRPDSEFTYIRLTDLRYGAAQQTTGPWTHSKNSYSRIRNHTNSNIEQSFSKGRISNSVIAAVCIIVFIVGLALGIVIGRFAIKNTGTNPSETDGQTDNLRRGVTDKPDVTTTNSPPNCVCPATPVPLPTTTMNKQECTMCKSFSPDYSSEDESATSLFAPLTFVEMKNVINVIENKTFTRQTHYLTDDRISHIFLYPQTKSSVLNYLDNNGTFPGRYAEVHVVRGSRDPPDVMEYKVGPVSESSNNMTIEKLRENGEISFNQRPNDPAEQLNSVVRSHLRNIESLLIESFDGASYISNTISPMFPALPSLDSNDRLSSMFLYYRRAGIATMRILPVTCLVHHPGPDRTKWFASDFYYLSQGPFNSGLDLKNAYNNGTIRKIKFPQGYWYGHSREYDLVFNTSLPQRPYSSIPPPRTYEPEGPRYRIKGHRVFWMDWEFEFTSSPIQGPAIYDVRFKGERIAYEISLQDITLIYSSQSSGNGPQALSDTLFRLGTYNTPRFGVDCPIRGTLIDINKFSYSSGSTIKKSACVFEADGQQALWRHGQKGLNDHYLVIRAAMNLGNYDYTAEWMFHLDGSLKTGLAASGYLYGAFWDPTDPFLRNDKTSTPFGYRISDFLLGPIHDHAFVFKVDLDILGTENSFETIHWKSGSTLEAFQSQSNVTEKPSYFYFNHTRYIEHEILETEKGFVTDPLNPKYFTVVNEQQRNFWGLRRGYRILLHSNVAENLQDHVMLQPWGHLKHQIAVTRRKDDEPYGSESWYGLSHPTIPGKGLSVTLNNETVRNTDLVLWITEKFLHAPTSEDVPMTLSVHNGFTLKPYNYFDRTAVFDVQSHFSQYTDPYITEPCYKPTP